MKKFYIYVCIIFFPLVLIASDKSKRDEIIVIPDVSLIDMQTAGVIDHSNFSFRSRFYNNGGVLVYLKAGVIDRLNIGASFMIDRLIGSQSPLKIIKPQLQFKFRLYDGAYYLPALSLGYDGQGYYYDSGFKKYMQKERGLYLVGSKEVLLPNFMLHGGFNIPDYDERYIYGFIGFNYNIDDKINLMFEYDNLFHSDSRVNVGMRMFIAHNFSIDIAFRNIGKNSAFINGEADKTERIVQFNTSFYFGDF